MLRFFAAWSIGLLVVGEATAAAAADTTGTASPCVPASNRCTFLLPTHAAPQACAHERIPPPCQPLVPHSPVGHDGGTGEALDLQLLVSIRGHTSVLTQRVWTFIDRVRREFQPLVKRTTEEPSSIDPQPFWSLTIYNATHTRVVQSLTRCITCLLDTVRKDLFAQVRAMDTHLTDQAAVTEAAAAAIPNELLLIDKPMETTPVGIYRALNSLLRVTDLRAVPAFRPYAHQHVIVLDGVGLMPEGGADAFLRRPVPPTDAEREENDNALGSLIETLTSLEYARRSTSFAVFYDAQNAFFNASLGSPVHSVAAAYAYDSSHYNPATALRRLARDPYRGEAGDMPRQGASFLAHMLGRAFVTRTYEMARLEVTFDGQLQHVWEPHYRHARSIRPWCSALERFECRPDAAAEADAWTRDTLACPAGTVGSILHGCHVPLPPGTLPAHEKDDLAKDSARQPASESASSAASPADYLIEVDLAATSQILSADSFDAIGSDEAPPMSSSGHASEMPPGVPYSLFRTSAYTRNSRRWTRDHLLSPSRQVETKVWSPDERFTQELIAAGRPCILKNTVVSQWAAMRKWNAVYLRDAYTIANVTLDRTKVSQPGGSNRFFDPDRTTPLAIPALLNLSMTYDERNLTAAEFFEHVTRKYTLRMGAEATETHKTHTVPSLDTYVPTTNESLYYYFGAFPSFLREDISPYDMLFDTADDLKQESMFLWFSSGGVNMHSHFDQDNNFFVQVAGIKRFTLVMPEQWREMHLFPRIHPLWHKSQADYDQPDLSLFPEYAKVEAYMAEVGPGDVLYIPPYTWHHVESVTPSVSLSIWSHDVNTLNRMESIYKHEHKFDLLAEREGRTYALRLYLDLIISAMYGPQQTVRFIQALVRERYRSLVDVFREEADDQETIESDKSGRVQKPLCPTDKIPTAQHVYGDAELDKSMLSISFGRITPATTRDILFTEYVEEVAAGVVGGTRVLRFFIECFRPDQEYRLTNSESEEHQRIWRPRVQEE